MKHHSRRKKKFGGSGRSNQFQERVCPGKNRGMEITNRRFGSDSMRRTSFGIHRVCVWHAKEIYLHDVNTTKYRRTIEDAG